MRWKAIYLILGLLIILGLSGYFFLDPFIDWSIERSLETALGVKTDVGQFHLNIGQLAVRIGDLQITNPRDSWRNIIETRGINFKLALEPLYSGRIVIDEITIEDLMINSPRKTSGKIKPFILPGPLGKAQTKLYHDLAATPLLDPSQLETPVFDQEKVFPSYQFQTNLLADNIKAEIENTNRKWHESLKKIDRLKAQLKEIQQKIQKLQTEKTRDLISIQKKLTSLKESQKSLTSINKELNASQSALKEEFAGLTADIADLKDTAETDYRELLKLAKLPDFDTVNFMEILIGKELLNESTYFLNLINKIQTEIPVKVVNPPKEKHPRGGQDIAFPGRVTFPRLLIKHVSVTGRGARDTVYASYYVKGSAEGITSEPPVFGHPMRVSFSGRSAARAFIDCQAEMNHVTPDFNDQFQVTLGNLSLPGFKLPKNPYLPTKLNSGLVDILTDISIKPDYFLIKAQIEAHDLVTDYNVIPESNNVMAQIIRKTITSMDKAIINYHLEGINNQKLKMKITSNIDELITNQMKAYVGEEVTKASAEIRRRVNAALQQKQQELEALRAEYQTELNQALTQFQAELDARKQEYNQALSQFQADLDARKKEIDQAKKELEDKLLKQLR